MYQISKFKKLSGLNHFITTNKEGNLSVRFEKEERVVLRLKKLFSKLKIDFNNTVKMKVMHGNTIALAEDKYKGASLLDWEKAPEADGLITNEKEVYLFLLVADCIPVIFYDPKKKVLGLMHNGWINSDKNTTKAMIAKLKKEFKVDPKNLLIGLGPSAKKESYIFDKAVQENDSKWKPFLRKLKNGETSIDVVGLCIKQLMDQGVLKKNIYDSGIDTVKDNKFYSHYRDSRLATGDEGRFAVVVGMK